jgi:membrane associated rhomboid family serine protease
MRLVLLTAVATWVLMQAMNIFEVGGFLVESTIAVVGGAAIGLIGSWYMRRQARKERREDRRD